MAKKGVQASFSGKSQIKAKKMLGPPTKLPNLEKRSREYLSVSEVNKLIRTAKSLGRHGERDSLIVLVMYRHALRVGELVDLRWDQIDLNRALNQVAEQLLAGTRIFRGSQFEIKNMFSAAFVDPDRRNEKAFAKPYSVDENDRKLKPAEISCFEYFQLFGHLLYCPIADCLSSDSAAVQKLLEYLWDVPGRQSSKQFRTGLLIQKCWIIQRFI